jgi:hypothetical protein
LLGEREGVPASRGQIDVKRLLGHVQLLTRWATIDAFAAA